MEIERTDREIVIRVPSNTDLVGLQRIMDYVQYREIAARSKATQEQIAMLAIESKSSWWEKNKKRFTR